MRRLLAIVLLATACDGGERATVRIDFTNLWQQAAQTDLFTMAELRVTGAGMDPLIVALTPADMSFELDVPSGLARTFAVEGYDPEGTERSTQYWGYHREDLVPGGIAEFTIPIARAGRVPGTVVLSDGATIPRSVELYFDPFYQPIEELPGPYGFEATDGVFSVPLPLGASGDFGEYEVTVGPVTVAGVGYELAQPGFAYLDSQGINPEMEPLSLDPVCRVAGTIGCCGDHDCVDQVCNLETHQCETPSQQVLVEVLDPAGVAYPDGVTVLVHDAAGVYLRQAVTDSSGTAIMDAAAGNMVSVLYQYTDSYLNSTVLTIAGVEPGDTLVYRLPGYAGTQTTQVGNVIISQGAPPTAPFNNQWIASPSNGTYYQVLPIGAGGPYTQNVFSTEVGDDGNIDFLGWAVDTKAASLAAFAVHTDVTPGVDMTFTLGESPGYWDASPLSITFAFTGAVGQESMSWTQFRDGVRYALGDQFIDVMSGGSYLVPAGFFDAIEIQTYVSQWPAEQRTTWHFVNDTWPATINHNFATDPLPPIDGMTPPTVDYSVATRPAVTWTSTVSTTQFDATLVTFSAEDLSMNYFSWWLVAPPTASGPAIFPDMSAAGVASGFLPENYDPNDTGYMAYGHIELIDVSLYSGYRSLLNAVGLRTYFDYEWPEQEWVVRSSAGAIGG